MARRTVKRLVLGATCAMILRGTTLEFTGIQSSKLQTVMGNWAESISFDTDRNMDSPWFLMEEKNRGQDSNQMSARPKTLMRDSVGSVNVSRMNAALNSRDYHNNSSITSSKILLVHVGKAGGMTLRRATHLSCLGSTPFTRPKRPEPIRKCLQKFAPDTVLPYRLQYMIHMWNSIEKQLDEASSFLFVLRHPVDRYISAFHYHHPEKRPKDKTRPPIKKFYYGCFPNIETLAQLSTSPWKNSIGVTYSQRNIETCSPVAIATSQGNTTIPHLRYNYQYYANKTVLRYKDKQVLVIRTEYEWQDIVQLDQQLGGSGNLYGFGNKYTHGSETYRNNTKLSVEGYYKLCCILVDEIEIYESILLKAANLDSTEKQKTTQNVHDKCGVGTNWTVWKRKCLEQMHEDRRSLGISMQPRTT